MARQAMATGSSPDATTTQCTTMQFTALNTVFLNPDSGWMNLSAFGSVIQWMNSLPLILSFFRKKPKCGRWKIICSFAPL
jgi:hypothetical protein